MQEALIRSVPITVKSTYSNPMLFTEIRIFSVQDNGRQGYNSCFAIWTYCNPKKVVYTQLVKPRDRSSHPVSLYLSFFSHLRLIQTFLV